ncbi:MAG: tetratricopeptide repeat protein [Planctomycetota bacterium]|nr:tetratricopeptide repeat protein [Planctomycetota bacterium]
MSRRAKPSASPPASSAWLFLAGAILVLLTALAYRPVADNGFIWDDDDYITRNANLHDLSGLARIWLHPGAAPQYYPLVHTTFWIEHQLWGLDPRGYHAVNVALHIASALLLWRLLERLRIDGRAKSSPKPAPAAAWQAFSLAWLVAALFALHPVCVESVAWATERKNVLMLLCYLLAATAYVRFERLDEEPAPSTAADASAGDRPRNGRWYGIALVCFIAAMLAKTVACSFGVAMAVIIFSKTSRIRPAQLWPLAPFLVIGAGLGLFTAWLERHHVGAEGLSWNLSFAERTLIAGQALWFYLRQILWPTNLCFIYERWDIDVRSPTQWLYPIGAAALVTMLWMLRRRIGRGPVAAVAFFGLTVFPALGFVNIYPMRFTWAADHYQYVACIGLIALTTGVVSSALSRLGRAAAPVGRVLAAAALLALAGLTHEQTKIYRDLKTLWTSVLDRNPRASIAYSNLGMLAMNQGDDKEAERLFRTAAEADPLHHEARNNLALLLSKRGENQGAITSLREAIAIQPRYAIGLNNLGRILAMQGKLVESATYLRRAVEADPRKADVWNNLGATLARMGKPADAAACFEQSLVLDPRDAQTMANLGRSLRAAGQFDRAIDCFQRALQLQRDDGTVRRELAATLMLRDAPAPSPTPQP